MSDRQLWAYNAVIALLAISGIFWVVYFHEPRSTGPTILPTINAGLNALSTILIILGIYFIKTGKVSIHKVLMILAFFTSGIFVVFYLYYHATHGDRHFLGQGLVRPIYFFILISHILLSVLAFPMVTASFFLGITGRIARHKKLAKFTYPIWLYISITGVVVYLFLEIYKGD